MPKALITGVTGQTGWYLADLLLARGWEVHGVVRGADETVLGGVVVHRADLTDHEAMRALVIDAQPDTVVNLAALSSVAQSWKQPVLTADLDATAVAAVLAAVDELRREGHDTGFVQASSAEIFGDPVDAPQTEATPIAPINPYGAAKAHAHLLTAAYRRAGARASTVILYNHESPRRPEAFVTRKITAGVARIARGKQDALTLGNLDARRDWGWAPDYADAIAKVMSDGRADDYIVATGVSHSIRDFVAAAFEAAGINDWEHLVATDPAFVRRADATETRGDATRIRERLGWAPTVSFAEMVQRMVAHDLELLDA